MGILEMRTTGWRNGFTTQATYELTLEGVAKEGKEVSIGCILIITTIY